jgi:hypothetical protein
VRNVAFPLLRRPYAVYDLERSGTGTPKPRTESEFAPA